MDANSCLRVSAKTGQGLDEVVSAIIERVPPPAGDKQGKLRMLLFDAVHDEYRPASDVMLTYLQALPHPNLTCYLKNEYCQMKEILYGRFDEPQTPAFRTRQNAA